jgi:hypothetical protein
MILNAKPTWPPLLPSWRPATTHDPREGKSATGMIVTGAHRSRIAPEFAAVIGRAIEHVSAVGMGPSLYVYGSVATGTAQVASSDVDLVTVGLKSAVAARMAQDLSAEYAHLCRGVEIGSAQLTDYEGSGDEAYGNRVFVHHYCVHLAGPVIGNGWPDFPADEAAARGFNGDIGLCADRWRAEVLRDPYPTLLGRRMARKALLAISGLVSVHDAIWTTDRVAAAWRWGLLRPELADSVRKLVEWSKAASEGPTRSEVQEALDGVVAEIVDEFQKRIGLWQ